MVETITTEIAEGEPKRDSRGRKILDAAHWQELIGRYETSGMTQKQFARSEGVGYHTFVARLGRHRRARGSLQIQGSPRFLEARLPSAAEVGLTVTLPGGMIIRGDNVESLARLIRLLEG